MQSESGNTCPACAHSAMHPKADYGRFATSACSCCGHMLLRRKFDPEHPDDYLFADDAALRRMLKTTRDKEFDLCVRVVKNHAAPGPWLDIGCSFGWFMERIRAGGYDPYGIEPSPTACGSAMQAFPTRVSNGEFPAALEFARDFPPCYSVVSAMDVLEHIPDPSSFLESARDTLAPDGVLLLKVPCNDGILFRLASAFSSSRRNGILGRLWQVDFNYPHWHYYGSRSIGKMLERHGLSVVKQISIPFSFYATAHDRIRNYDGRPESAAVIAVKTLVAYGLITLSHLFRRFDNVVVVATRSTPGSPSETLPR